MIYFFSFLLSKRMVVITVENYSSARVHTITVKNNELFWVKMIDVQNGLSVKSISDLLTKEMQGEFETKRLTKDQKRIYKRTEYNLTKDEKDNNKDKNARSDLMGKVIKNCRGTKKCNDGADRSD